MTNLSERIKKLPESATLTMAAKALEMQQKQVNVINLSLGEPNFPTPAHIQNGAIEAIHSGKYFSYPPVNGYLDLRTAISKKFHRENNLQYNPEQIVVSNGAKQSIANTFMALLNPGDEVIVLSPYWVSYPAMILLAEGKPVYVQGDMNNDFKATAFQIKQAITSRTRAIIFSSPCNPTGSVFSKDELNEIAAVIKQNKDIIVISDEIYEKINFTGKHFSIGSIEAIKDQVITINGFSKGFAMTGWRVGYLGAPRPLAKAITKVQGQTTSANCSIAQRAAYTALTGTMQPTLEMEAAYKTRRENMFKWLSEISGLIVNKPEGAFYFFPNASDYIGKKKGRTSIQSMNDLCLYLLENARVSLVTGEAFGVPDCIRISYAASMKDLEMGVLQIKEALYQLS